MIKFFFGRESRFVLALELVGIAGFAGVVILGRLSTLGPITKTAYAAFAAGYLAVRFFACRDWYKKFGLKADKKTAGRLGIRLHFGKVLVPVSYLIAVTNLLLVFHVTGVMIYVSLVLFIPILYVNLTLLYLHLKDRGEMPPNGLTLLKG